MFLIVVNCAVKRGKLQKVEYNLNGKTLELQTVSFHPKKGFYIIFSLA